MPHTGLIDETLRGEARLLMRARLHVKGSLERFENGMVEDAIAAMYDAISSAMQRYTFPQVAHKQLEVFEGEDLTDDTILFEVLKRSGIIDGTVEDDDFKYITKVLDDAIEFKLDVFDSSKFIQLSKNLLVQMGVIPRNADEFSIRIIDSLLQMTQH